MVKILGIIIPQMLIIYGRFLQAGLPIGTIVDVSEVSTNTLSASTGTISKETVGDFSLIQSGDVLIAYQSTSGAKPLASAATFLAAIYTDDNYAHNTNCDGTQGWYNGYTCASDFSWLALFQMEPMPLEYLQA